MRQLTWASWRAHRRRYVATFLAVFLGVAFCAATISLTAAARAGAENTVALRYGASDVVVFPSNARGVKVVEAALDRLPDVEAASRVDQAYLDVRWPNGATSTASRVVELASAPTLRWQRIRSGALPQGTDEVAVDEAVAAANDVEVGSRLSLSSIGGSPKVVTVTALVASTHDPAGAIDVVTAPSGLAALGLHPSSYEVDAATTTGGSTDRIVQALEGLSVPLDVERSSTLRQQALLDLTQQVDVIGRWLLGFAFISLFVAGLVIANTFRIVMAQRVRDLALLRCVGAGRGQVLAMSLGEAALLGLAAAVAGSAAGHGLAFGLVSLAGDASLDVPLAYAAPGPLGIAGPVLLGLVLTLLASAAPAWWAARVSPLAAMRPSLPTDLRSRSGAGQAGFGVLLGVLGCLLMGLAATTGRLLPGVAGGAVAFVGALLLTPVVVPASIRLLGRARALVPKRLRGGVPAELAVLDATRNPRRTAATAAALIVGVALISMMSVGAASVSATESSGLDRVAPVDLTVSGGRIPTATVGEIEHVDGVATVEVARGRAVDVGGQRLVVAALTEHQVSAVVRDPGLVRQLTRPDVLVVPATGSYVLGGSSRPVRLLGEGTTVRLRPTYSSLASGPLLVSPTVLSRLGGASTTAAIYLRLADGGDPATVQAAVQQAIASSETLRVDGGLQKRSTYEDTINVLLLVSTALLAISVVIALVGVGNTLSLSVLERTREHGLLRALGLTSTQLRLLLAIEAVLVAGAGAVLGLLLGVAFGWAGTLTLLHGASNHAPVLTVPYARLALILVIALAAGGIASVLPARRAIAMSPTAALSAD